LKAATAGLFTPVHIIIKMPVKRLQHEFICDPHAWHVTGCIIGMIKDDKDGGAEGR
jgi:hypothetical protein